MLDKDSLVKLAQQLIQANTSNPPGNEKTVADILVSRLRAAGLEIKIFEAAAGRPNVLAIWRGKSKGNTLLINGHMDTVPPGPRESWKFDPFSGKIINGQIYGRGSTDMKGALAAMVIAVETLKKDGWEPKGTLALLFCSNEEMGDLEKIGMRFVAPKLTKELGKIDCMLIGDVTGLDIVVAEKGALWLEFTAHGKEAHGSMPWLGINAIEKLGQFLIELRKMPLPASHPMLGKSTISINTFSGGYKTNVVPALAKATVDIRLVPGEDKEKVKAAISNLIKIMQANDPDMNIEMKEVMYASSSETDKDEPFVKQLAETVKIVTGRQPEVKGEHGSTGASIFKAQGIPAVVCGPGKDSACHVSDESIAIQDIVAAADVYVQFAKRFLDQKA
ncbi:MAG: M20 family metallopeptidase [Candidatus Aenigmatarchaeota archaeon]